MYLHVEDNAGMMGEVRVFGTAEYHYIQKGFYMDQIDRFLKVFPNRYRNICLFLSIVEVNTSRLQG